MLRRLIGGEIAFYHLLAKPVEEGPLGWVEAATSGPDEPIGKAQGRVGFAEQADETALTQIFTTM